MARDVGKAKTEGGGGGGEKAKKVVSSFLHTKGGNGTLDSRVSRSASLLSSSLTSPSPPIVATTNGRWWMRAYVMLFAYVTCLRCSLSRAQIFTFSATPIPKTPRQIAMKQWFFVYGADDNPPGFLWLSKSVPSVTFEGMKLTTDAKETDGIQVSLIGDSVWKRNILRMKTGGHCCVPPSLDPNVCPSPHRLANPSDSVAAYDVKPIETNVAEDPVTITKTDMYMLLLSNCGRSQINGVLDGRVIVRNSYGYLSGLEFPKLVFYFWLMITYFVVLSVWTFLLAWHWKRTIHFHYCIEGVILLSLLECVMQFAYYADWNNYGSRNSPLLVLSILTTVLKNIFSYMLVLVASLGWGVTKPTLERPVIFKIQAVVLLYVVLDSIRQVTDEFIYSPNLPVAQFLLVVVCLIPISILNGVIFYWVFSSLTDLLEVLEEQKQFEKLQMFKRLLAVLVATLVLFTIALFVQLYAAASDVTTRWQVHWWLSDGVPHMLFLLVLVVMMCLWKPNEHSRKLAYFQELPDDDEFEDTPKMGSGEIQIWGDSLDLDEASSEESEERHDGANFDIPTHHSHPVALRKDVS